MALRYQYKLVLTLANRQIKINKINKEIKESFKEFNIRSISSRNPKEIIKCEINEDENLLYIWLNSNSKIDSSPLRGLNLFTKIIIEQLSNDEDNEKKNLLNDIIRNKCFFKLAQEPIQIMNIKLEESEKKEEWDDSKILTNNVAEKFQDINIVEADKVIRDLFYNMEKRGALEEKAKDEILKLVEKYLIEKGEINESK